MLDSSVCAQRVTVDVVQSGDVRGVIRLSNMIDGYTQLLSVTLICNGTKGSQTLKSINL